KSSCSEAHELRSRPDDPPGDRGTTVGNVSRFRRTYREADGQRVEGSCRLILRRNFDRYYLTDLEIYADGAIYAGGGTSTDVAGLAEMLRTGEVSTSADEGAHASAHHLGSWRFAECRFGLTPEMLLGEVSDEIDYLNRRPDSTNRCLQAVEEYLADATE